MAFYYLSFDFFWAVFTSVLPPFLLTILILSFLVASDGSPEEEKRGGFAGKVEALSDSGEKSAGEIAVEVTEAEEPIGTANSVREETGLVQNGEEVSLSDDDWEGIERTELERVFAAAVSFVGCARNADRISKLGGDLTAQLFGLHKIATVGPCREPQPMAFRPSARAKWNAWQGLENMDQNMAMELYIELLSRTIPRWLQDDHSADDKQDRAQMFSVSSNQPIAAEWRSLNELKENFDLTKSIQILESSTQGISSC